LIRLPFRIGVRTLLFALLGIVIVLAATAAVLLARLDWRTRLESYASHALDRRLAIAGLRIGWENPLAVELSGVRLANASWGSIPDMLSVERLSATIDLPSLLRGVLRFENLRLEKPLLLLERDASGVGNWHFGSGASAAGGLAIVPKNRRQFPTLIDFGVHDGQIIYRATSSDLRIDFHDMAIRSPGDDQSVSLTLDGAYNGTPTRLTATTDSYIVMRNETVPFGADFSIANAAGTIGFRGTMMEPLDFDEVRGKIDIDAKTLGEFLRLLGASLSADFPVAVAGAFERSGAHWSIAEAQGRVAADRFGGTLSLTEGGRGAPDALTAGLDFAKLDLAPLIGSGRTGKPISLRLDSDPAATVDARIAAKLLTYETRHLAEFVVALRTRPGEIAVGELSFAFADGKVTATGSARTAGAGSRIAVNAALSGADAGAAASTLAVEPGQIAGKLEGRLILEMTGATLSEALKTSSGEAVLAMTGGRVARDLVERASTDLRTLFRTGEGWIPVSCLLGIATLRNGVATIAPLRLRTPETTLLGSGQIDLVTEKVDMVLKTEAGTTSLLALKLPLRITGDFHGLHVVPSFAAPDPPPGAGDPGHLASTELQLLAERNPCRH
jgi:AsmA family protein